MPFTEESVISQLEENLKDVTSVTTMLEEGHTPESLLNTLLKGFDIEINETIPTQFYCNCDKTGRKSTDQRRQKRAAGNDR